MTGHHWTLEISYFILRTKGSPTRLEETSLMVGEGMPPLMGSYGLASPLNQVDKFYLDTRHSVSRDWLHSLGPIKFSENYPSFEEPFSNSLFPTWKKWKSISKCLLVSRMARSPVQEPTYDMTISMTFYRKASVNQYQISQIYGQNLKNENPVGTSWLFSS